MAYEAKDGKKFTNKPPMMAHDRSMAAKSAVAEPETDPLAQPGQDQGMDQGQDQGGTEQVMNDFESVMQAVHSGQQPNPQAAEQLVQYFSQFAGSQEPDGDEQQPEFE